MALSSEGARAPRPAPWNDPKIRSIVIQVAVLLAVIVLGVWIVQNTAENLRRQGIASGFGFLRNTASFDIGFSLIDYSAVSSYGRAIVVGILNTLLVASIGIVLATILGFLVGLARLSGNALVRTLATVYIETLRNIPLLLQLIFWYVAVLSALPQPRDSLVLGGVAFLNNRGLTVPRPIVLDGFWLVPIVFVLGIVATIVIARWSKRRREATGRPFPTVLAAVGLIVVLPVFVYLLTGRPLDFEYAEIGRFRLTGGVNLVPEFVALLAGLVLYTAAFIGENVRSGIQAVGKGQWEASGAIGLRPGQTMRLVVIPQALRVIVPPLTSQYLNLTKNSSLAIAIGYPDLVGVGGTVLNQSGQAVEVVAIWMAVYLSISLLTSLFMNWYNARIALVER